MSDIVSDEPGGRSPPLDAGLRLRRRHEPGRRDRRRLSRLRRDRQGLREHRLPRRRRLEPCVRTARLRRPVLGVDSLHIADDERSARDLWDNDWTTGGYYWTVVAVADAASATAAASSTCRRTLAPPLAWQRSADRATPRSPRRRTFPTRQGSRPAAGCSPPQTNRRGSTERRSCRGSRLSQPLRTRCSGARPRRSRRLRARLKTRATSAVLPLTPGTWWYRVRGLNPGVPAGSTAMNWSSLPASLVVATPTFKIVR